VKEGLLGALKDIHGMYYLVLQTELGILMEKVVVLGQ